jgi:LPXTG-motif cell wall-anchored protein
VVTVVITGTCDNDTFTVTLSNGVTICTVTTNAVGTGSGTCTVPSSTTTGAYDVLVADAHGNSTSAAISVAGVTPAVTTATTAPLAFTGTDAVATSALGAGVLCLGGLLVLGSRKRRRNTLV